MHIIKVVNSICLWYRKHFPI